MKIVLIIIAGLAAFVGLIWLIKILWNWLVPALFKGPRIRFSQALGLFILCRLLFGFGFSHNYHGYYHHPFDKVSCEQNSVHKHHGWPWEKDTRDENKNEMPDKDN